mgnify:FL=1
MAFEDAYFSQRLGEEADWKVLAGYRIFNWTATEAFHPADVVNSRNFDSNVENLEKKGELTLELERTLEDGSLNFYYWPRFEEPDYPGKESRLGSGIDLERPVWIDQGDATSNQNWGVQYGARFQYTLDDADFSFHYLNHIDRNFPVVGTHNHLTVGTVTTPLELRFRPYFFRVSQMGGTLVYNYQGLQFKVEAAHRNFEQKVQIFDVGNQGLRQPDDHSEVALGLEYGLSHESSGAESTLLLEYQTMFGVSQARAEEMSVFQNDVLLAWRYAFNDTMGKELFLSFIFDIEREHEFLYNLSYQQRLSDVWKYKTGVRIYDAPKKKTTAQGLELLDKANHAFFNLIRYF